MKKIIFAVFSIVLILSSCKRDKIYEGSDGVLEFTADTLTFDTVFTSVGSITRYYKVKNPLNEAIQIDKITLAQLPGTQFRINVDGFSGTEISDILIPAKDSIYIFAEVTVDPNNQNEPFILLDEVSYFYNNIQQKSYLRAWGQNAYFHYGEIIEGDSIWENDKPHVVIRNDSFPGVGVDSFGSLTIKAGCQVYFGQNSAIFSDGPVIIGEAGCLDSVILQSNKIEDLPNGLEFDEYGGLWLGVILRNGASGVFNNVIIKNASYGIAGRWAFDDFTSFEVSNQPEIEMDKVQIKHSSNSALFCLNAKVNATNCLFFDNGSSAASLAMGGQYNFENCTFYGSSSDEALALSNYASNGYQGQYGDLSEANFTNCIVYGGNSDELLLNNEPVADFNYLFENSLIRTTISDSSTNFVNCLINENPSFKSISDNDYSLREFSPCIGAGKANNLTTDLKCNFHNTPIDIGAIAYRP